MLGTSLGTSHTGDPPYLQSDSSTGSLRGLLDAVDDVEDIRPPSRATSALRTVPESAVAPRPSAQSSLEDLMDVLGEDSAI